MADISNTALGVLVGIALVVSVIGLFSLPSGSLTGLGTQGQARVNIGTLAALNVTRSLVDFGNGTIQGNARNCTVNSEKQSVQVPASCWNGTVATGGGFTIVNIGNVKLNVTVKTTKNSSTSTNTGFWGVTGGKVLWKCRGSKNTNGTSKISSYRYVSNASTRCFDNFNSTSGQDAFTLDLNLTIPETATGLKNDTITFTASRACSSAC